MVHRYALKSAGGVRPGAGYPEFRLGPAFAVARFHKLVGRLALNLPVNRAPAGNRKAFRFRSKLVRIAEPTDDLQMHLWHPLTLWCHVQLQDHLIADALHFGQHSGTASTLVGVPQNDSSDIAVRSHPFAVVPANGAPARRPAVINFCRDCSCKGLNGVLRDRDRLLPVNLLKVLDADSGEFDKVGCVRAKGHE